MDFAVLKTSSLICYGVPILFLESHLHKLRFIQRLNRNSDWASLNPIGRIIQEGGIEEVEGATRAVGLTGEWDFPLGNAVGMNDSLLFIIPFRDASIGAWFHVND